MANASVIRGCTDSTADNYNSLATVDNNSCRRSTNFNISGEVTRELLKAGDGVNVSSISLTNIHASTTCTVDLYMKRKFKEPLIEGRYINPLNYSGIEIDELGIPVNFNVYCYMPYEIYKVKGGYKVGLANKKKMSNGKKYLSDKPLSQEGAVKQMRAVVLEEKKAKNDNKK